MFDTGGVNDRWLGQTRPPTASEHGILPARDSAHTLQRVPAPPDLADLVERFWLVSWDLPAGHRGEVTLVPHPCVNLVFDAGQVWITGVGRDRFTYRYEGTGRVFGVKFRPGGFAPCWREPVATLTGRTVPLAAWWGEVAADRFAADLAAARDLATLVAVATAHLRAHRPAPDPTVDLVGRIVRCMLSDRSVARVADVAARFGLSPRTLQRLFHRYVGVPPKWVLRRYRLHEAAARITEAAGDWARVAAELGYFDQSHFIREFTRVVGRPPAAYARTLAAVAAA